MARRKKRAPSGTCHYCRRRLERATSPSSVAKTRDHVLAKAHGGMYKVDCCRACNQLKGCMSPDEWREFREAHPEWWKLYKTRDGRKAAARWARYEAEAVEITALS